MGIDCKTAMRQLYDFLDGELSEPVAEQIREHLARCQPCFAHTSFERDLLAVIGKGWSNIGASAELRSRIMRELRNEGLGAE